MSKSLSSLLRQKRTPCHLCNHIFSAECGKRFPKKGCSYADKIHACRTCRSLPEGATADAGQDMAGIYGMNFDAMPELKFKWSYPFLWLVMISTAAGMLIYFRRLGWIGPSSKQHEDEE